MTTFKLFNVPSCVWLRKLGDYPPGATGTVPDYEDQSPPTVKTKRGIPLGGIGTGSFMWNLTGSFGPFEFDCGGDDSKGSMWGKEIFSGHEERYLLGAGFYLSIIDNDDYFITPLSTEDVSSPFVPFEKGKGAYGALFPKAWVCYELEKLFLEARQLTPYVANDDKWLSTPGALFTFRARGKLQTPLRIRLGFLWPNAIYKLDTDYLYPRKGLHAKTFEGNDFKIVSLRASDLDNVPETQDTEWTILGGADKNNHNDVKIESFCFGQNYFQDFYQILKSPEMVSFEDFSGKAGAVVIEAELSPEKVNELNFVLTWDFPIAQFKNPKEGTCWLKRYKEFFPGKFSGKDTALFIYENRSILENLIDSWWKKIVENNSCPDWLKQSTLNELYYDIFGSSFWESGCLTKPKKFGNRKNQHLSFVLECPVYRDCETLDVHYYEARHRIDLTRSIERDLLLGWADLIQDEPAHRTPHDAGSPVNDPWFKYGQYFATAPNLEPLTMTWKDLPCRYVQLVHAYFKETNDYEFLKECIKSCEDTIDQLMTTDEDNDGIPDCVGFDTSYDGLGLRGVVTHVATLFIGALEALADMELTLQKPEKALRYTEMAETARNLVETKLWDETRKYYRAATIGDLANGVMADALCGQLFVQVYGLKDVLNINRIAHHLLKVYYTNVVPFDNGLRGALNLVNPDGSLPEPMMARGVWPGGTYFTAALMVRVGKRLKSQELINAGLATAKGVAYTTYEDEQAAFWFNTPAIWHPGSPLLFRSQQNQRPRAVWELYLAVKD
jgi:non-lysosomal glucosylceramidase